MKKELFLIPLAALALCVSSCATYVTTSDIYEARMVEATTPAPIIQPLTAQLELLSEEKVSDTWTFSASDVAALGAVDNIRARALCLSAEKHGADVIVGALYKITYTASGSCTVVITGFPAKFTNWRPAIPADTVYLRMNPAQPMLQGNNGRSMFNLN